MSTHLCLVTNLLILIRRTTPRVQDKDKEHCGIDLTLHWMGFISLLHTAQDIIGSLSMTLPQAITYNDQYLSFFCFGLISFLCCSAKSCASSVAFHKHAHWRALLEIPCLPVRLLYEASLWVSHRSNRHKTAWVPWIQGRLCSFFTASDFHPDH